MKQGTLQRWVRDCAAVTDDSVRLRLLDGVLRAGGKGAEGDAPPEEEAAAAAEAAEAEAEAGGVEAVAQQGGGESSGGEIAGGASSGGEMKVKRHPSWRPPAPLNPVRPACDTSAAGGGGDGGGGEGGDGGEGEGRPSTETEPSLARGAEEEPDLATRDHAKRDQPKRDLVTGTEAEREKRVVLFERGCVT